MMIIDRIIVAYKFQNVNYPCQIDTQFVKYSINKQFYTLFCCFAFTQVTLGGCVCVFIFWNIVKHISSKWTRHLPGFELV